MSHLSKCLQCKGDLYSKQDNQCLGCGYKGMGNPNLLDVQELFITKVLKMIHKDEHLLQFATGRATGKTFALKVLEECMKRMPAKGKNQVTVPKPWVPVGDIYTGDEQSIREMSDLYAHSNRIRFPKFDNHE